MKGLQYLFILITIFLFLSCEKDELTIPTEIIFKFSMESHHAREITKSMNAFNIEECNMVISSIEFDGRRNEGEDYYFTKQFSSPLTAEMHTGITNQNVSFDAPQGVYNKIDISFSIGTENENALVLNGLYQQGAFIEIPIRVEYSFIEQIKVQVKDPMGNSQVVLKKENPTKANVIFNTPSLFQLISYKMIQEADIVDIEGKQTILINTEVNNDIFNLIASRIDNSIRVVFE